MCGRYTLTASPEEIRRLFRYADLPNFPPRYNIAPTQPIAVVTAEHGERRFVLMRWGLVPSWVKDPKAFSLLLNARAETAVEKPAFRAAMRYRRALVPASGFYEWRRSPSGAKQPFFIRPRHGGPVAFAGLTETWSSADGSEIDTAAILTVQANRSVGRLHDRMPAVVRPEDFDAWLDVRGVDAAAARDLLVPVDDDFFECVPVSERVNRVINDDERLIEALAEPLPPIDAAEAAGVVALAQPAPPTPAKENGGAVVDAPVLAPVPAPAPRRRKAASGQLDLF